MVPHIHTLDGITVVIKGRTYSVSSQDRHFEELVELVSTRQGEAAIEALLTETARKLQDKLRLAPDMEYSGGVITYRGEVLRNYAADRLVALIDADRDYAPVARFLAKLQANPSKRVVDNLYSFLEKGSMPLAEDGDFLAYKAVRGDWRDIHSGQFDNSIGSVCEMPRNRVDEDPNRTCSAGLHVCSFGYLPHFSHANGHVVVVKVSPADVVAIPADYNDTKMRVSRYVVIEEVKDYYTKREDVLGAIGRAEGVKPGLYTVVQDLEELGSYYTFEEAKRQAEAAYNDFGEEAAVEDQEGYVVWTVNENGAG